MTSAQIIIVVTIVLYLVAMVFVGVYFGKKGSGSSSGNPFFGCGFFLIGRTPQDEQLADHLHTGAAEFVGYLDEDRFAFFAVVSRYADFDEFVSLKLAVDFFHHRFGETAGAKENHGVEMMRLSAQRETRIARKSNFAHKISVKLICTDGRCRFRIGDEASPDPRSLSGAA